MVVYECLGHHLWLLHEPRKGLPPASAKRDFPMQVTSTNCIQTIIVSIPLLQKSKVEGPICASSCVTTTLKLG